MKNKIPYFKKLKRKDLKTFLRNAEKEMQESEKQKAEQAKKYLEEPVSFSCKLNGVDTTLSIKREDLQEMIRSSGVLDEITRTVDHYNTMNMPMR
jgi:phage regulator Rha-like protein